MADEDRQNIDDGMDENGSAEELSADNDNQPSETKADEISAEDNGGSPQELPAEDLFVGDIDKLSETPTVEELFADSQSTYEFLAEHAAKGAPNGLLSTALSGHKRFSATQKVLLVGIVIIAIPTVIGLMNTIFAPAHPVTDTSNISTQPPQPTIPRGNPLQNTTQASSQQDLLEESVVTSTEPASLKMAADLYLQQEYHKACTTYQRLRLNLPSGREYDPIKDFLQFKVAVCKKMMPELDSADQLFRLAAESRYPAIKVMANYHLSHMEIHKKEYLKAQSRAYQAIALIDAVDFDADWATKLRRDCHFMVAESVTRNILSLCDADKDLPEDLWLKPPDTDPFDKLNREELMALLNSGTKKVGKGLLAPYIQKLDTKDSPERWSVACNGVSIEELLGRFAANADVDIQWKKPRKNNMPDESTEVFRKRPVYLYMQEATTLQLVTTVAGCVGYWAYEDENDAIKLLNPSDYDSLATHLALLSRKTLLLWQSYLLIFHEAPRIPNAHFAIGLLQAQSGKTTEAIAEFKLAVNRFTDTAIAPYALLHTSRLKTKLNDYLGASGDLRRLVEQYPDAEITAKAYLYLADITSRMRKYDDAEKLYRKVYNIRLTAEMQSIAALGAGKNCYQRAEYESAAEWFIRYIGLTYTTDKEKKELHSVYYLLGKSYLGTGQLSQACDAFQCALTSQLTRREYADTVSSLVKGYMEQEKFIEALNTTAQDGLKKFGCLCR